MSSRHWWDALRTFGPVWPGNTSYWWAAESRNKRGITLELRRPEGRALCSGSSRSPTSWWKTSYQAHSRAGVWARMCCSTPTRASYWSVSPASARAAVQRRPGYDRVGSAFGGLWHLWGGGGRADRAGLSVVDYLTGSLFTAGHARRALRPRCRGHRQRPGDRHRAVRGGRALLEFTASHYSGTGTVRPRMGNSGPAAPRAPSRRATGAGSCSSRAIAAPFTA